MPAFSATPTAPSHSFDRPLVTMGPPSEDSSGPVFRTPSRVPMDHERPPNFLDTPSPTQVLRQIRLAYGSSPHGSGRPSTPRKHDAPDRFIPCSASVQSFRMGSPTSALSPDEKLLRRHTVSRGRSSSPDRPRYSPMSAIVPSSPRAGHFNRTISAGAVGVFGIGIGAQSETPSRPRGREVNGHIFADKESPEVEMERHELRLSAALGVDRSRKVLNFSRDERTREVTGASPVSEKPEDKLWETVVQKNRDSAPQVAARKHYKRNVPTTPFRVLDAPGLRDDYYCSLLAYSSLTHSLAVGLHSDVYSWNEASGARPFDAWSTSHVTSLAFSCAEGGNNILAIGRIDGSLSLWNPSEPCPRLDQPHAAGIACIAWKPIVTPKPFSVRHSNYHTPWYTEDLLVGDEVGNVHIYAVEWGLASPQQTPQAVGDATITLLKRLVVHTQQICGLAWSSDGEQFATGGNDNVAYLFDTTEILNSTPATEQVIEGGERYRWPHGAAVKAIAFCPWQRSLLATGGGSNDRCIHFFHTFSGAPLATINVSAQVTSLLWSTSRREIAATFGYANPDHPIRIAVFSWPECRQIVQVPWQEDMRALYAVAYPGGPAVSEGSHGRAARGDEEDEDEVEQLLRNIGLARGETARRAEDRKKRESEGCIIVAASDETVRFHEVWSDTRRGVLGWRGVLGGSDILEELEGIEGDGRELIR